MSKSTVDLCSIMRAGGGVKLPCNRSAVDFSSIARAGGDSGAKLTITGAEALSTVDLCSIGRANPGNVFFEFSS